MDLLQGWASKVLGLSFFCKFTDLAAGTIKKNSATIFSIHSSGKFSNIYRLSLASNHLKKKKEKKQQFRVFLDSEKGRSVVFFFCLIVFIFHLSLQTLPCG